MEFEKVLKSNGLRSTAVRLTVLEQLAKTKHAQAHTDLDAAFEGKVDRVTLYRTLNSFEEKGIVHKVIDAAGVTQFALCHSDCSAHQHDDHHVHLYCNVCEKTYCLHDVSLPKMNFPDTVEVQSYRLLASGVCSSCKEKA